MRILGLDIGSKTIGIAVSDELMPYCPGGDHLKAKGLRP